MVPADPGLVGTRSPLRRWLVPPGYEVASAEDFSRETATGTGPETLPRPAQAGDDVGMTEPTATGAPAGGSFGWRPIEKPESERASANLPDYDTVYREFSWDAARAELTGLPRNGLNIAYEAIDRHCTDQTAQTTALRWLRATGGIVEYSYADLAAATNRFANVLRANGICRGERVCVLLGRRPELYISILGALKAGCVVSPLFSAFGPEPVRQRLAIAEANALVTSAALYRRKVAPIRCDVPSLRTVLLTDGGPPDGVDLSSAMNAADSEFDIVHTHADDAALLHFTSGTTGRPKGAVHVHGAVLAHLVTARYALDLRAGDVFWCTADPGWVTGMSYGVIAPLCLGATVVSDEAEFDPHRWYDILTTQRVSVWYTAPTALRMLMRYSDELPEDADLSHLRFITSVGEPLNPEVVLWGERVLGRPVHDNWWQTETGAIMIANFASAQVRPGSMGRPLPGIEATILRRGPDGRAAVVEGSVTPADPGAVGEPRCALAGHRCSAATGVSRNAMSGVSRMVGTSAVISPAVTRTATTGSSAAPTTSSSPRGTWSARSRWRAP